LSLTNTFNAPKTRNYTIQNTPRNKQSFDLMSASRSAGQEDKRGGSSEYPSREPTESCLGKVAPGFLEMMCQKLTLYVVAVPNRLKKVIGVELKVEEIEACNLVLRRVGWGVVERRARRHRHPSGDTAVEEVAMFELVPYLVFVDMVPEVVADIVVEEAGIGIAAPVLFAGMKMPQMLAQMLLQLWQGISRTDIVDWWAD